jgi:hypothetical protein
VEVELPLYRNFSGRNAQAVVAAASRKRPPKSTREAIATLAELGLKGEVDPTGGGHCFVRWISPNGKNRALLVGKSPSDCRADRNSRAFLRRIIKKDSES